MKFNHRTHIADSDLNLLTKVFGDHKDIRLLVCCSRPVANPGYLQTRMDFVCNPNGTLRWIYPRGLRRPLFLSTYNSPTPKAKIYALLVKLSFLLGLKRLIKSGHIYIEHLAGESINSLAVEIDNPSYAIFTGTVGPNRKAIVAATDYGSLLQFAKIPLGINAVKRLAHEIEAQNKVALLRMRHWRVPTGLSLHGGGSVLENIRGLAPKSTTELDHRHLNALFEMVNSTLEQSKKSKSKFTSDIQQRLAKIHQGQQLPGQERILSQLSTLLDEVENFETVPFSYAHGDFTPWNMFLGKDRLRVYDWEVAGTRPVFYDFFHFIFQTGVLIEHISYPQIREKIADVFRKPLAKMVVKELGLNTHQLLKLYLLDVVSSFILQFQEQQILHDQAEWLLKVWAEALENECRQEIAPSCRKVFLREFSAQLPHQQYAIMRGESEPLENLGTGSDLDILSDKAGLRALTTWSSNHPLVQKVNRFHQSFMDRLEIHFVNGDFLSLDIIIDIRRKAIRMLSAKDLLNRVKSDKYGIKRLTTLDQLEYATLFYGLNQHLIPTKYIQVHASLTLKERIQFSELVEDRYGLPGSALHLNRYSETRSKILRNRLKRSPLNPKVRWPARQLSYFSDLWRRFRQVKGMVITFSGVDGAGKSTILDGTAEAISHKYRKKVKVLRHRPSMLPILSALRHGKKKAEKLSVAQLPRKGTNRNFFSSLLRFSWYAFDYVIGQWYVWLCYERRGYVVLYDRYFYDMIADPERTNFKLPAPFTRMVSKLIRKPRLNFLLTATPEVIRNRKQELSKKDILVLTKRYRSLFQEMSKKSSQATYITLHNKPIETSLESVLKAYRQAL